MRTRVHSWCLLFVLVAGCDHHHNSTGPSTGVVAGAVTSSLGGMLDSVSLVVTPAGGQAMSAVLSSTSGAFRVADVPVGTGKGSIAVSSVPFNCTAPSAVSYTGLEAGDSVVVPIEVTCVPPTGTISGTITSSLGGGIANASIVVTPTGGTALTAVMTSGTGTYTVTGVGLGGGSIAVSSLPGNCTAPAPTAYTGLKFDSTMTVNITVTCAPLTGTINGSVFSSLGGGIANATVTITPTGQSAVPAVQTSGTGTYSKTVPVGAGTGSVAVTSVPNNCTTPAAVPYTGLASGQTKMVNVTVTCTPLTGSLTVTLTVPTGVTSSVTVTGPGGYNQSVTATRTLTNLTPGSYTIVAANYTATGSIVNTIDTAVVTGSPATVTSGATASASVTYSIEARTGMWVANQSGGNQYTEFAASQLTASGSPIANAAITNNATGQIDLAFDHSSNLWSVDIGSNLLLEFTASSLSNGAATPAASINSGDFGYTAGLAFDANGNLWVANYGPCEIQEFTAAQLSGASGSATITPNVNQNPSCANNSLSGPWGMAFDASGNLWVADVDHSEVYKYPAASLSATGALNLTPTVILKTTDNLNGRFLAFDASGNLWVSSGSTRIIEYSTSQLAATGTLTPAVTITTTGAVFEGLAFDNSGNLWAVDNANTVVDEFTPSQLSTGGTISPTTSVNVANGSATDSPWTVAFNPHSSSLPLYNRVQKRPVAKK